MRRWRSTLYLPASAIRAADRELRQKGGVDAGSSLWPACDACSEKTGTRFAVEAYEVADKGKTISGEPYTDIRARCHGEEEVIRIEGCDWNMKRDGNQADIIRVAALAGLTFFAPEGVERKIPGRVFRAFIGSH